MNLYLRMLALFVGQLRRPALSLWSVARTPFRVLPTDLDVLGHMNNGKYLTVMDLGRVDLMVRSGWWSTIKELGWYPVVASQTITYRRSLRPWQSFEVHTRILGFDDDGSSFLEQTFVHGDTIHAQAVVRAKFLKESGGRVERHEMEAAVGGFPEELQAPEWVREWAVDSRAVARTITSD